MVLTKYFNFDNILYFLLGFYLGLLLGSNTVYAANWNENNNFENINSMTQYTTLNDILSDSAYSADKDEILDFVNSDFDYKYIISYCNSSNCDSSSSNRSIDLIGFNDPVKIKVEQNKQNMKINFIGSSGDVVSIYDHSQIWGGWGEIYLTGNYLVDNREYFYGRSVFDITYYSNFNNPLPNFYMSDTLFKGTNFIEIFFENIKAFREFIIFGLVVFIIICLIFKRFNIFLTPLNYNNNYRGGKRF